MKLIKLSDIHYVIIDDSEIKINDWCLEVHNGKTEATSANYIDNKGNTWWLRQMNMNCTANDSECKKITHSTQPLEKIWVDIEDGTHISYLGYDMIKEISLSEVEEVIYGYNFEKLFLDWELKNGNSYNNEYTAFEDGFNTHKELVKDKLFTIADMKQALVLMSLLASKNPEGSAYKVDEIIQSLLPTEWNIEIQESEIKLI